MCVFVFVCVCFPTYMYVERKRKQTWRCCVKRWQFMDERGGILACVHSSSEVCMVDHAPILWRGNSEGSLRFALSEREASAPRAISINR